MIQKLKLLRNHVSNQRPELTILSIDADNAATICYLLIGTLIIGIPDAIGAAIA